MRPVHYITKASFCLLNEIWRSICTMSFRFNKKSIIFSVVMARTINNFLSVHKICGCVQSKGLFKGILNLSGPFFFVERSCLVTFQGLILRSFTNTLWLVEWQTFTFFSKFSSASSRINFSLMFLRRFWSYRLLRGAHSLW